MLDFKKLFESAPDLYMVISPQLDIVGASDAYLAATMTRREDVIGRPLFEVFPDNPDDPNSGTHNLRLSLHAVLRNKAPNTMAVQKYDVRDTEGRFEERFWSPVNMPVFGDDGEIMAILHRAEDVTEFIRLKNTQQAVESDVARMTTEIYLRAQEVQKTNQQLAETNLQLEAADRVKSEFLATMSHELRTPLNAIIGFSELLKLQLAGPLNDKQREYMEDIFNSGRHLLSLINDILDLSKIEAGKMTLDLEEIELSALLDNCFSVIRVRAESNGIDLKLERGSMPESVIADRRKTTQMIYNLLSNAVKFTSRGGQISLLVNKASRAEIEGWRNDAPTSMCLPLPASGFNEFIEIAVQDSGCGIEPADTERLFKPFSQIDTSLARTSEGTGLGLALVSNLVSLHQGSVAMSSTPNQGSRFVIWLPWRDSLAA
jgi:signal transduction histidine kinase